MARDRPHVTSWLPPALLTCMSSSRSFSTFFLMCPRDMQLSTHVPGRGTHDTMQHKEYDTTQPSLLGSIHRSVHESCRLRLTADCDLMASLCFPSHLASCQHHHIPRGQENAARDLCVSSTEATSSGSAKKSGQRVDTTANLKALCTLQRGLIHPVQWLPDYLIKTTLLMRSMMSFSTMPTWR